MINSWNEKCNYLERLIKQVSMENGGDDDEFLNEYSLDIIMKYSQNLDEAIRCFESLLQKQIPITDP